MGEGENSITIKVNLDTSDFQKTGPELKKATESFAANAKKGFEGASKSTNTYLNSIKKTATNMFRDFGKGSGTLYKSITKGVGDAFKGVGKSASDIFKGVGKGFNDAIKGVGKGANDVFKGIGKGAGNIFKSVGNLGSRFINSFGKNGTKLFDKMFDGLLNSGKKLVGLFGTGGILTKGIGLFKRDSSNAARPMDLSFKSLMSTAKRLIPMMIGVRGVFSALQRGASSFLASNKQLQNQLNAVWTAIGNVIGPVITMLVNLLSTLVSYLISFLHLIGLSSMSASEAAKKTKGAAGAMQKSLMQFDELNKLQDNSGGGGAGSLVDAELPEVLAKLGDAIKTLIADLKLTWKQAWDENGRGEKMMEALKQLLIDIIDLMAEFVLALDRAWMNADNGKQIFADILEIITNLAVGFDAIVKAFTEWFKTTDWLNIIIEDVRKIFDAVNETSVIWREKIAPILATKVEPLMNAIAKGFHNILVDIEAIVRGINDGLSSAEGTAMINSLADLAIAWTEMKLAAVDLVLGSIAKIDWTSFAAGVTRISDGAIKIMNSLTTLFGNQQVQKFLAKFFDAAWTAISMSIALISNAISSFVNSLNNADWDSLIQSVENVKKAFEVGTPEEIGVAIGELLNTALDQVPWDTLGDTAWKLFNGGIKLALGVAKTVDAEDLGTRIGGIISRGINTIAWEDLGNLLGSIIGLAITFVANLLANLNIEGILDAIVNISDGFFNALKSAIDKAQWRELGIKIANFIRDLVLKAPQILTSALSLANTIVNAIISFMAGLFGIGGENQIKIQNAVSNFFKNIEVALDIITLKDGTKDDAFAAQAIAVIAAILGFTMTGSLPMAIILTGVTLSLVGALSTEEGSDFGGTEGLLDTIIGYLPLVTTAIGLFKGGPGGAALGYGIGTGVQLIVEGLIEAKDEGIEFNSGDFVQKIIAKLNGNKGAAALAGGAIAGGLAFKATGNLSATAVAATLGAGVVLSLLGSITQEEGEGFSFDTEALTDKLKTTFTVAGMVAGGALGAKIGFKIGGLSGAAIGFFFGSTLTLALSKLISLDSDGIKFDTEGFWKMLGAALLGALAGAVLITGVGGAIIGISVGLAVFARLNDVTVIRNAEKAADQGREAAKEDAGEFFDAYAKEFERLGYNEDQILTFKNNYENIAVSEEGGIEAANKFIESWIKGIKANKTAEEITHDYIYGSSIEAAGEAGKESAENFHINVEAEIGKLTDAYGVDIAKAYFEKTLSGDFSGTAQEFIDKYADALGIADKTKLESTGTDLADTVIDSTHAELEERTARTISEDTALAIVTALGDQPTKDNAQALGESLVDGFCTGLSNKQELLVTTISTVIGAGLDAIDGSEGKITTWYSTFKDTTLPGYLDGVRDSVGSYLDGEFTTSVINGSLNTALTAMDTAVKTTTGNIVGHITDMSTTVSGIMGRLASSARGWGQDIGSQIASGMMETVSLVAGAASRIADVIFSYLHFSEPDVGPLKNFHTFMPDMMNLMAQGISQNADKPESALERVAQGMADSMSLLGQLNGIANNVDFMMPAMATGSIVPYSVGARRSETKEAQQSSLYDTLVSAFTEALNNMKPTENYVYLDGKQIADSTTKWQRRADRAGGK